MYHFLIELTDLEHKSFKFWDVIVQTFLVMNFFFWKRRCYKFEDR